MVCSFDLFIDDGDLIEPTIDKNKIYYINTNLSYQMISYNFTIIAKSCVEIISVIVKFKFLPY